MSTSSEATVRTGRSKCVPRSAGNVIRAWLRLAVEIHVTLDRRVLWASFWSDPLAIIQVVDAYELISSGLSKMDKSFGLKLFMHVTS